LAESYQGDFFVRLVAPSQRPSIWTVMDDVTNQITSEVPGINFDTHQLLDDMIGDMVGRRQPIVVTLSAKDPTTLAGVADQVAHAIAKVPGIEPASVNNGVVPAGDALEVHVDPGAAAMQDITPAEIDSQLDHYLNARSSPAISAQCKRSELGCGSTRHTTTSTRTSCVIC
jgi:multidrug efflux pump subunit AcrB